MSPEFRVQIPDSEKAIDDFSRIMAQNPSWNVVSIQIEAPAIESVDWKKELNNLETCIFSSRQAINEENPEVLQNFRSLQCSLLTHYHYHEPRENIAALAQDILKIFEASIDYYEKTFSERPVFRRRGGQFETLVYRKPNTKIVLTPRELRLLIFTYGLASNKQNLNIVAYREGIQYLSAQQALRNAESRLVWQLANLENTH